MGVLKAWPWAAAALSGLLLILCFPPWNQGWLCWIALTPLLCALFFEPRPVRFFGVRKAALGYVTGLIFFPGTFFWLSTTLAKLYENRWLLTLAPLLSLFLALYFAFWAWFVGAVLVRDPGIPRFPRSLGNLGIACAGACAWLVHEWVRERLFGGFGWNPLGVALYREQSIIQIAEFTGTPGLSFLVVFTNLMAVIIVRRIIGEIGPVFLKRVRWEFSFTMALIAATFAFGVRRMWHADSGASVPLRFAALQFNIPQDEKRDPEAVETVLEEIRKWNGVATAADAGQASPQLVIWPESAIPTGMFGSERSFHFVIDQLQDANYALLLGTVDFDPQRAEDYNTAILLSDHGREHQSYRKIHLVPFGEYLPLRPVFQPFVGQLVPGDFTPGREYTVLQLSDPPIKLGALVCFEDTLGDLTRQFPKAGAQLLVNITNDGWFARSPAAEQHLANATLRAVENRRPLIRCGNTGVTCTISATGEIDQIPPFQTGFVRREINVPTTPSLTVYTRLGDWLSIVAMVVVAATGIGSATVRRGEAATKSLN